MEIEMNNDIDIDIEDELGCLVNNMSLDNEPMYNIDQTIEVKNIYCCNTINMNFYQIWSIFRFVMPNVENGNDGLKYYEYNFYSSENEEDIFVLYSYGHSFININEWKIGSTTNNKKKIQSFKEHLLRAIECYEDGYKGIEQMNFDSNNPKIHFILQEIKINLIKNEKILKTL